MSLVKCNALFFLLPSDFRLGLKVLDIKFHFIFKFGPIHRNHASDVKNLQQIIYFEKDDEKVWEVQFNVFKHNWNSNG